MEVEQGSCGPSRTISVKRTDGFSESEKERNGLVEDGCSA
jgi:hypothetical protein